MKQKIVIAGGTGFVGNYLIPKYEKLGYQVLIISRQPNHIKWENEAQILAVLENATMLINLAGKSVDCRYTEKNKQEIFDSRIKTTKILGSVLLQCKNPPPLWINSSTATIYRHATDRAMTEATGEIGSGFSVNVATNWEKSFFDFDLKNTRQVALRMAIVLGKNGGVVEPLKNLVKFGLGGRQGDGKQVFSWIHIQDLFNIIQFVQNNNDISGIINTSSPNPINNQNLMQTFRKMMNIKIGIPLPKWLLKIGAILIKTETELILKSRWVVPERLLNSGFVFTYPKIDNALTEILTN